MPITTWKTPFYSVHPSCRTLFSVYSSILTSRLSSEACNGAIFVVNVLQCVGPCQRSYAVVVMWILRLSWLVRIPLQALVRHGLSGITTCSMCWTVRFMWLEPACIVCFDYSGLPHLQPRLTPLTYWRRRWTMNQDQVHWYSPYCTWLILFFASHYKKRHTNKSNITN